MIRLHDAMLHYNYTVTSILSSAEVEKNYYGSYKSRKIIASEDLVENGRVLMLQFEIYHKTV